jgi:hypothetical protein
MTLTSAELARARALVVAADPAWIAKGAVPMLKMPATTFAWEERMIYFANTGVAGGELWLEVRAFDGPARKDLDPNEIDWCIPAAYAGAPEIERLGWKIGWGEGWSDSMVALRARFDARFHDLFAEVVRTKKLAIATIGEKTASLLMQLDRNLDDVSKV